MADYSIFAETDSGWTYNLDTTSILQSRNEDVVGSLFSTATTMRAGGYNNQDANLFYTSRIYLNFDLSNVDPGEYGLESVVLSLISSGTSTSILNGGHKFYVVEADTGNSLTTADYPNLKDRPSSGTYADIVPLYADSATAVSAAGTTYEVTLNSAAISDINSAIGTSTEFDLAVISEWDYTGDFTEGVDIENEISDQGLEFHSPNANATSFRPLLVLTDVYRTKCSVLSGTLKINSGKLTIK